MNAIKAFLDSLAASFPGNVPVAASILLEHGKTFKVNAELPPYMAMKQCYANCLDAATSSHSLVYAEGYALHGRLGIPLPLSHAWLVNAHGQAIDPTWGSEFGNTYFGVKFSRDFLAEMTEKTKQVSVFESLYALRLPPAACREYVVAGIIK